MSLKSEEAARLRDVVSGIYADGYATGAGRVAREYGHAQHLPATIDRMGGQLSVRLDLVDKALESYFDLIENKAKDLLALSYSPEQVYAEVEQYARYLAEDKGQLISEIEWAKANMDGAGTIVGESGERFAWAFPHFDTASAEHEECPICEAIREGSPYSTDEAEQEGYPDVPHPYC